MEQHHFSHGFSRECAWLTRTILIPFLPPWNYSAQHRPMHNATKVHGGGCTSGGCGRFICTCCVGGAAVQGEENTAKIILFTDQPFNYNRALSCARSVDWFFPAKEKITRIAYHKYWPRSKGVVGSSEIALCIDFCTQICIECVQLLANKLKNKQTLWTKLVAAALKPDK